MRETILRMPCIRISPKRALERNRNRLMKQKGDITNGIWKIAAYEDQLLRG